MLFPWGREGVPGEIEQYIRQIGTAARLDRGEDVSGVQNTSYSEIGVEQLADSLLADLRSDRSEARGKKAHFPKLSHEIASWCFMLHAYCAKHKAPAPQKLLWLTFEALSLKEGQPSRALERNLGLPENISNLSAYLDAAALDGEADAAGAPISLLALEKRTGISRQTLRRWREMRTYQQRRKVVAWSEGTTQSQEDGHEVT